MVVFTKTLGGSGGPAKCCTEPLCHFTIMLAAFTVASHFPNSKWRHLKSRGFDKGFRHSCDDTTKGLAATGEPLKSLQMPSFSNTIEVPRAKARNSSLWLQ